MEDGLGHGLRLRSPRESGKPHPGGDGPPIGLGQPAGQGLGLIPERTDLARGLGLA
jgi:hypothetical protein